ncbi:MULTISPECIES: DoxX family protein [Pseudovibrio]|uniref:DoxX family protein n=1 Tax=Stappiaceae TaxID=2821832 RepID=UPI002365564E|nr:MULTISPECIES: DoxX family protein [Pseudovibrio]MDD7911846.1 DoxX family protein [Pseudovibrio exalbescens]MDX5594705.1 DoxX family protein [Pseudovibrio sp. SPO723]
MSGIISPLVSIYTGIFGAIERAAGDWFLGLLARVVFASVLFGYFWNSALTKISDGLLGFLTPTTGAYAQILPQITEAAGYDVSQIAFFPYGLIVLMGTWAEFVLPVLVVIGLFTRGASLAMIGFLIVMTYVDITGHHVDMGTIGGFFDNAPNSVIADQRVMWGFLLLYLVIRGPGLLSVDGLLGKRTQPTEKLA